MLEFVLRRRQAHSFDSAEKIIARSLWVVLLCLVSLARAYGQHFEVTLFVGYRAGGSLDLKQEALQAGGTAKLNDSVNCYGFAPEFALTSFR